MFWVGKYVNQLDTIYTDFSKAFDCVNHDIVLKKFSTFIFSPKTLYLFRSYPKDRYFTERHNGYTSEKVHVNSDVPQGSNLKLFLFILFSNDLPSSALYSICLLSADDFFGMIQLLGAVNRYK